MNLKENPEKLLSLLFKYLPVFLFCFYSLLMFFFYLGPVAVFRIGSTKMNVNVYDMFGNDMFSDLIGAMGALIAFSVLSLLTSILCLVFLQNPIFDIGKTGISEKLLNILRLILKWIPCLFYFSFFIIACVIYGKIGALENEFGLGTISGKDMFSPGACPALILTFTILFALIQVFSLLYDFVFKKRFFSNPMEEDSASDS